MTQQHHESIGIAASPEEVYDLVAAVDDVPDLSPECRRIEWIGELRARVVGAHFRGQNGWRGYRWWRKVHITVAERGQVFAFPKGSRSAGQRSWSAQASGLPR